MTIYEHFEKEREDSELKRLPIGLGSAIRVVALFAVAPLRARRSAELHRVVFVHSQTRCKHMCPERRHSYL